MSMEHRPRKRQLKVTSYLFLMQFVLLFLAFYHPLLIQTAAAAATAEEQTTSSCVVDTTNPDAANTCVNNNNNIKKSNNDNDETQNISSIYDDEDIGEDGDDEEEIEAWEFEIDWGEPQLIAKGEDDAIKNLERTFDYMMKEVAKKGDYRFIRHICKNEHERCSAWAANGHCDKNPAEMIRKCAPACMKCKDLEEMFYQEEDEFPPSSKKTFKKKEKDIETKKNVIETPLLEKGEFVSTEWGVPQNLGIIQPEHVRQLMEETHNYMTKMSSIEKYKNVTAYCANRHENCSYWATNGECEHNVGYMNLYCPAACQTCKQLSYETRCEWNKETAPNAWENPGDLNKMFQRVVDDPSYNEQYGPISILSSPKYDDDKPWVITLDNFLSDEECNRLIEIGHEEGFARSTDVGKKQEDGTYTDVVVKSRTSTNSWCSSDCNTDPIIKPLLERIEKITNIPDVNHEWLQILHYETGQFYKEHHDYIIHENERPQGPRIMTVYLYLNDVEGGGGTRFPNLDLTVQPKKGRAIVWPNVLNHDPMKKDKRMRHEALEVEAGMKYGANAWVHQRDYKTRYEEDCV